MKHAGQIAANAEPTPAPVNWQTADLSRLGDITATHPEWVGWKARQLGLLLADLRKTKPDKSAALLVLLKAQVRHWQRLAEQNARSLALPGVRDLVGKRLLEVALAARIPGDDEELKLPAFPRRDWSRNHVVFHPGWLDDWQSGAALRAAFCLNAQRFSEYTRGLKPAQVQQQGRAKFYSFAAVLVLLERALFSIAKVRRPKIAQTIWNLVRRGSPARVKKLRIVLRKAGADCRAAAEPRGGLFDSPSLR